MLSAASTGASFVITEAMLEPIVTSITSNSIVLIPVGLTIMGIMVGYGFSISFGCLTLRLMVGMVFVMIRSTFQVIWVGIMMLLCTLFPLGNR